MVFYVTRVMFRMTFLINKFRENIVMDDGCHVIHCPKAYLLLSATWDEILSWMIEILMKNHWVSESICNIVIYNPQKKLKIE